MQTRVPALDVDVGQQPAAPVTIVYDTPEPIAEEPVLIGCEQVRIR